MLHTGVEMGWILNRGNRENHTHNGKGCRFLKTYQDSFGWEGMEEGIVSLVARLVSSKRTY